MEDQVFQQVNSILASKQPNQEPTTKSPMLETLEQVESTLRQHFEIKDWQGVRIILGAAAAHYNQGQMLWMRIIGPSRSGRTELLRCIAEHPDCEKAEAITPSALRGGFKKKKEDRLLYRINNKLVVTKDLAALLTARKDMKTEVFGLLRPIKDGELVADYGSDEGHLKQYVYFDWLVATTQVFEQYRVMESLLGERFVDLRWRPGDREEMAYRAGLNNPYLNSTIRPKVIADVISLLNRAKIDARSVTLADNEIRDISKLADKAAVMRTPVVRDSRYNVIRTPDPEIGTGLTQDFCRIVLGLKTLGISDYIPYLIRLVWDCMPSIRAGVLECLVNGVKKASEIAEKVRVSERTVEYVDEDLQLLGVDHLFLQNMIHI